MARCYKAIGKPERLQFFTYDRPHTFPPQTQQRVLEWFDGRGMRKRIRASRSRWDCA